MEPQTIILLGTMAVVAVHAQGCANWAINDLVRQAFLDNNNNHRSSLARGLERDGAGGYAPKAKQMPSLVYDCSAEASAQSWANQCDWGHSPSSQRPGLGQNLYMSFNNHVDNIAAALNASNAWWAELADFGVGQTNILTNAIWAKNVGHYTQMAWDRTTHLGCGIAHCGDMTYVVCHYGPAGNTMDHIIYSKGEPCTGCPTGTFCSTSEGLCKLSPTGETTATVTTTTRSTTTKSTTITRAPAATRSRTTTRGTTIAASTTINVKPTKTSSMFEGCTNSYMNNTVRLALLNNHNNRRSSLARGLEVDAAGGFAPKAKQMPALTYDCAAENLAQSWVNQCTRDLLKDPQGYGQNIFWSPDNRMDAVLAAASAANVWWDKLSTNGVGQTNVLTDAVWNRNVGTYTQMAWDLTLRLGCGVAQCSDMTFIICLYGPSGNYLDQAIYKTGEPCTGCSEGKTCSTSEGLCK